MLQDGIYDIVWSNDHGEECGVAEIRGHVVTGQGSLYSWSGLLRARGETVQGRIRLTLNQLDAPVLGMFRSAELDVSGSVHQRGFEARGRANGHHVVRIDLRGRRRENQGS